MTKTVPESSNPLVCVIDQDAEVRESLVALLTAEELDVRTYENAEAFLETIGDRQPDCIIVELNLPEMTGLELLRQISARKVRLPSILLSSDSDVATAVQSIRAGAIDFIEKPFVNRVLLARVREALGSTR
ncbi:MAG: response regulator [Gammaproteobacteria bacterium]